MVSHLWYITLIQASTHHFPHQAAPRKALKASLYTLPDMSEDGEVQASGDFTKAPNPNTSTLNPDQALHSVSSFSKTGLLRYIQNSKPSTLNPKPFRYIQRIDEMERIIRFLLEELTRAARLLGPKQNPDLWADVESRSPLKLPRNYPIVV